MPSLRSWNAMAWYINEEEPGPLDIERHDVSERVYRIREVVFTKRVKDGEQINHHARIITYVDIKKTKIRLISLLTNDMDMKPEDIVAIYRKRWKIELLFKQLKQNFLLRYFYCESTNAIKIQIWVTLIANLLLMVMQKRIKRT